MILLTFFFFLSNSQILTLRESVSTLEFMDAKTLAKSKRAHSLHHSKKHHPNPTSKAHAGSATASSRQKPSSKPEKQKSSQSPGSRALPSNWDRYEDENDPGLEDLPHTSTSQPPDVIVPKSKGADYGHLISEAKAQAQSYHSVDSLTFLNDIVDGIFSCLSG